jgi:DNA-binding CsgD family transcriptional regulator/tetratricopeptide (TPR) repeat protein
MAERQGDYQSARSSFEEGLSVFKELGDKWGISGTLYSLGSVYTALRDYESARVALQEDLAITEELGTDGDAAEAFEKLGKIAYFRREDADAHKLYMRSLSLFQELGDRMGIARCLMDLAGLVVGIAPATERQAKSKGAVEGAMYQAPAESAARLLGTVQVLIETVGFQLEPDDRERFNGYVAAARTQLGEQAFDKVWSEGQAMTVDEAIAYAQAIPAPEQSAASELPSSPGGASNLDVGRLTIRERQVTALVTLGKTNREIADELVVSERTVEGHVNSILTKLGFRSRAQISAWAVERGLVKLSE